MVSELPGCHGLGSLWLESHVGGLTIRLLHRDVWQICACRVRTGYSARLTGCIRRPWRLEKVVQDDFLKEASLERLFPETASAGSRLVMGSTVAEPTVLLFPLPAN